MEKSLMAGSTVEARAKVNGVLAFHKGVEEQMLHAVCRAMPATKGNPAATLAAVDRFCYERHWMMHVGDIKGRVLLDAALRAPRPLRAVELGAYCGYSAVLLGSTMQAGDSLLSLDVEPQCIGWAQRLISHAGLDDGSIEVALVPDGESVAAVAAAHADVERADKAEDGNTAAKRETAANSEVGLPFVTLLFIDHDKRKYLEDLIAMQPLLVPGAIVVADNVDSFDGGEALQPYIDYVRNPDGPFSSSEAHRRPVEYSVDDADGGECEMDSVEVSVYRG